MKLMDYIKGVRRGKEAHRIEKEAMGDPFLAETLEGFDTVEGDHAGAVERLRKQIAERSGSRRRKRMLRRITAGAAALLLLFLIVGVNLLIRERPEQIVPYLAEVPESRTAKTGEKDSTGVVPDDLSRIAQALPEPQKKTDEFLEATGTSEEAGHDWDIAAEANIQVTDFVLAEVAEDRAVSKETVKSRSRDQQTEQSQKSHTGSGIRISGRVTDPEGVPLAGVSVYVKEDPSVAAMTGSGGSYSITAPKGSTLVFAFIGYDPQEYEADANRLDIGMQESKIQLEEVVVVGYATEKRSVLTGSVSTVSGSREKDNIPYGIPAEGMEAFREYVEENRKPVCDEENNPVMGSVLLKFKVGQDGKPVRIRVEKGLSPQADKEARRLLKEGPDWETADGWVQVAIEFPFR